MLNAIIIDDEMFCIETLKYEIERCCPNVDVVATAQSGQNGIEMIKEYNPDVVFLDIEMPYMNAFEMLQHLDDINFDIIFTTAYNQFAIKAIKVSALDYLLKPVGKDELVAAVDKVSRKSHTGISGKSLQLLMEQMLSNQHDVRKIALPTVHGLEMIRTDHIVVVEADSNYTVFRLLDGKKLIIAKTLKQVEEMLSEQNQFLRVHQSYMVNLHHVERYDKGKGGSLLMVNETRIPVSRSKKDPVVSRLTSM
jgi:two-component system LytT family response regulator